MKFFLQVVRWETGRHLRNKQFLIGLLITPLIFALFGGVPSLLQRFDRPKEYHYLVVDQLGALEGLQERLAGSGITLKGASDDPAELREQVSSGAVDGYFRLDASFIESGRLPIYMKAVKAPPSRLDGVLSEYFTEVRINSSSLDPELLSYVTAEPQLLALSVEEQAEPSLGNLPMAIGFSVLLFFLIMSSGSMLLMSALQEKRDRMSEVVLSSISPGVLMAGKIAGHFLLGIFQIAFWLAIGLPIAQFGLKIPVFAFITPELIPLYALFTLLGYLLFAALFVGIGATMESMESASNTQGMVFMMPALSFFVMGPVIGNPDGVIARFATLFPITSPTISILRTGLTTVPTWELVTASLLLLVTTGLVVKLAAKVFRTGMLMYGKNPSLRELWKWMRYS